MNGLMDHVDILIHLCNIFFPFIHWIHSSIYRPINHYILPYIIFYWTKHACMDESYEMLIDKWINRQVNFLFHTFITFIIQGYSSTLYLSIEFVHLSICLIHLSILIIHLVIHLSIILYSGSMRYIYSQILFWTNQ